MRTPAPNIELVKLVYMQMSMCLKALDTWGFERPAAHLDASINSLRKKVQDAAFPSEVDQTLEENLGQIDMLIAQTVFPHR